MLQGLDQIPWDQMVHAYGSAADVPGLIRDLISSDADTRKRAIGELHYNLWHQGTVYEATPHAVPFLIEILDSPTAQDKAKILAYLAHLAQGSSFIAVHQPIDWAYSAEQRNSDEFKTQLSRELDWVSATYAAVLKGYVVYVGLLPDPKAIDLITLFPEKRTETLLALNQMTVTDLPAQIALVRALGQVITADDHAILARYLSPDFELVVRMIAAQGVARILQTQTPPSVLDVIRLGLVNTEIPKQHARLAQWEYDLPVEMGHALYYVGRELADPLLPLLCDYPTRSDVNAQDIFDAVETLLAILFSNLSGKLQLDALQLLALKRIADAIPGLKNSFDVASLLETYHLPTTADALRDWANI